LSVAAAVVVDTSVLSLSLRRPDPARLSVAERQAVAEFLELGDRGRVALLGIVRQELLIGVRHAEQFERLKRILDGYEYLDVTLADHDSAASFSNRCRSAGIGAGDVDMLICAVAARVGAAVFTTDGDFARYARLLPVRLHAP
jgi:predicted nucleic acid-binding protein